MSDHKRKLNLSLDLRIVSAVLLITVIGLLLAWMPWNATPSDSEVIKVTGETVIKAEPDQYVFYPAYQFKNADKEAAVNAATAKTNEVVAKLKELGVADSKIKSSVDGYRDQRFNGGGSDDYLYTAQITVTVDNKEMAQKVQDYVATTAPLHSVTPQGTFSEAKRKELESRARDEATKDARAKAEQSAENLGFRLGRVKSVEDGSGFPEIMPLDARGGTAVQDTAINSLKLNPGENEIRYSVTVTYYLR